MTTFVAVYRGETVADARLVAVSADPALVAAVSERLLDGPPGDRQDPVFRRLDRGRRGALRVICREANDAARE